MAKSPSKVMVLGMDGLIAPRLYKHCRAGKLPTISRIIDNGVWAKNGMVPFPTITSSNWTSIATGAWPSTHGVTDFNVHNPGDSLDEVHGGFFSHDVKSEFVWNAIAKAAKRSIVVNYPATWPPVLENGIQIGGAGVEINQWFEPAWHYGNEGIVAPPALKGGMTFRFAQHGQYVVVPGGEGAPLPRMSLSNDRLFCTRTRDVLKGEPLQLLLKQAHG